MPLSAPRPASRQRSRCGSFARDGVGRSYAALGAKAGEPPALPLRLFRSRRGRALLCRSRRQLRRTLSSHQASEASVPSSERSKRALKRAKQACPHASEASVPSRERSKRAQPTKPRPTRTTRFAWSRWGQLQGADDRATQAYTGTPRSEGGRRRRRWPHIDHAKWAGGSTLPPSPCVRHLLVPTAFKERSQIEVEVPNLWTTAA